MRNVDSEQAKLIDILTWKYRRNVYGAVGLLLHIK